MVLGRTPSSLRFALVRSLFGAQGFNRVLESALSDADGAQLVRSASDDFAVSARQLHFLRTRLAADPGRAGGGGGGGSGKRRSRGPVGAIDEPTLNGVQAAELWLMTPAKRTESRLLRALKWAMLIEDPRPMPRLPVRALRMACAGRPYCPRLVASCALTFAAVIVYAGRATLGRGRMLVSTCAVPAF